jgi:hypothetical protein
MRRRDVLTAGHAYEHGYDRLTTILFWGVVRLAARAGRNQRAKDFRMDRKHM